MNGHNGQRAYTSSNDESMFRTHRLANGLQIVGQVMPDFASAAVAYFVRTGARDEQDLSIAGVSHFLEHMMFKGTTSYDWREITLEFNKIGAQINASTSQEMTIYHAYVLGEYLDRALELLSEMMHPRLLESDFEMEKEVIINEIARSEEQPRRYASRHMMHTYFKTHPLGNFVLGSRDSIRSMKIGQMRDYWQRRYAANNLILAVAGNVDWNRFVALAEHYCGNWRVGEAGRIAEPYEPERSTQNVMVDSKLKQQVMFVSMPGMAVTDADYYAGALGASVLGGSGSRLYWNIRHKGLAMSAGCGMSAMDGTGMFTLSATTMPENAATVLKMMRNELVLLLKKGVAEDELQRAKNKWIRDVVLAGESPYSRMYSIAHDWRTEGRLVSIDEEVERIERVTRDDVLRTFRRFPLLEKQVVTTLGPLDEKALLEK